MFYVFSKNIKIKTKYLYLASKYKERGKYIQLF